MVQPLLYRIFRIPNYNWRASLFTPEDHARSQRNPLSTSESWGFGPHTTPKSEVSSCRLRRLYVINLTKTPNTVPSSYQHKSLGLLSIRHDKTQLEYYTKLPQTKGRHLVKGPKLFYPLDLSLRELTSTRSSVLMSLLLDLFMVFKFKWILKRKYILLSRSRFHPKSKVKSYWLCRSSNTNTP